MIDRLVFDSSAILTLFIPDANTPKVEKLFVRVLEDELEGLVPDLAYVECANVMWKYVRRGLCDEPEAREVVTRVRELPLISVPTRALFEDAYQEGLRSGITAYDAVYVTLASVLKIDLVTGDKKLAARVRHAKYVADL